MRRYLRGSGRTLAFIFIASVTWLLFDIVVLKITFNETNGKALQSEELMRRELGLGQERKGRGRWSRDKHPLWDDTTTKLKGVFFPPAARDSKLGPILRKGTVRPLKVLLNNTVSPPENLAKGKSEHIDRQNKGGLLGDGKGASDTGKAGGHNVGENLGSEVQGAEGVRVKPLEGMKEKDQSKESAGNVQVTLIGALLQKGIKEKEQIKESARGAQGHLSDTLNAEEIKKKLQIKESAEDAQGKPSDTLNKGIKEKEQIKDNAVDSQGPLSNMSHGKGIKEKELNKKSAVDSQGPLSDTLHGEKIKEKELNKKGAVDSQGSLGNTLHGKGIKEKELIKKGAVDSQGPLSDTLHGEEIKEKELNKKDAVDSQGPLSDTIHGKGIKEKELIKEGAVDSQGPISDMIHGEGIKEKELNKKGAVDSQGPLRDTLHEKGIKEKALNKEGAVESQGSLSDTLHQKEIKGKEDIKSGTVDAQGPLNDTLHQGDMKEREPGKGAERNVQVHINVILPQEEIKDKLPSKEDAQRPLPLSLHQEENKGPNKEASLHLEKKNNKEPSEHQSHSDTQKHPLVPNQQEDMVMIVNKLNSSVVSADTFNLTKSMSEMAANKTAAALAPIRSNLTKAAGKLEKTPSLSVKPETKKQSVNVSRSISFTKGVLVKSVKAEQIKGNMTQLKKEEHVKDNQVPQGNLSKDNEPATPWSTKLHKVLFIDRTQDPRDSNAPGQFGRGVAVPEDKQEEAQSRWNEGNFNVYLSDLIPLDRAIEDTRPKGCSEQMIHNDLPTTSIIICFVDEVWSTLLRSVYSVLNRSPEHLVKEIILVDDFSTRDYLKEKLDIYLKKIPKVRVLHLPERHGLIRARIAGANIATGDVLTFLDSHIECNVGWLEPLLEQVRLNRKKVACPVIEVISALDMSYITVENFQRGIFTWPLNFAWKPMLPEVIKRNKITEMDPIKCPVMAGGLFSIEKNYFYELGTYDPGLDVWGGENMEISFKIWMCGGEIEIIPCSRVGHIFRNDNPYSFPKDRIKTVERNLVRVAEVWLDEYKEIFYGHGQHLLHYIPDIGDLMEQRQLREKLQCKGFNWYIENVFPDMGTPLLRATGMLSNPKLRKCLAIKNSSFVLESCDGSKKIQQFNYTWLRLIRQGDLCITSIKNEEKLTLQHCDFTNINQKWLHKSQISFHATLQDHILLESTFVTCLEADPVSGSLIGRKCNSLNHYQKWRFESYLVQ